MRITILTVGSHGDMRPMVALGLGLQRAGHEVCLATHSAFANFIGRHGLDFFPVEGNPRDMLNGERGQAWLETGRNPIRFAHTGIQILEPLLERMLADSWRACQDAEAIIYATFAIGGAHIAEKLAIPGFMAMPQPISRTRAFANTSFAPGKDLGGLLNWLTHLAGEQLFWQLVRRPVNRWRRDSLNLPEVPFLGPTRRRDAPPDPILYSYSPAVFPKPGDWPSSIHVTGYWFLDEKNSWQPPAALVDFLDAGPPPVYVGFGSMTPRNAAELAEMAISALRRSGQRGILSNGWGGLAGPLSGSDDIFVVESVPHDWLFPQVAAVVHHGGAGTTAAGLRAGIPTVVVPFFFDQPFWGQRVAQLGVGPTPVLHKQLTTERLTKAIRTAVTDPTIKAEAVSLGEQIRAEDGVANAVAAFQAHVSPPDLKHGLP